MLPVSLQGLDLHINVFIMFLSVLPYYYYNVTNDWLRFEGVSKENHVASSFELMSTFKMVLGLSR